MKKLHELLERFTNLTPPDRAVQDAVVVATKEITGLTLARSGIGVHKGVIYIKTKPVMKSEILLHKREILNAIKNKLKEAKTVVDIH